MRTQKPSKKKRVSWQQNKQYLASNLVTGKIILIIILLTHGVVLITEVEVAFSINIVPLVTSTTMVTRTVLIITLNHSIPVVEEGTTTKILMLIIHRITSKVVAPRTRRIGLSSEVSKYFRILFILIFIFGFFSSMNASPYLENDEYLDYDGLYEHLQHDCHSILE